MKTEKLIEEFRKWFGFKEGKKFRFARGGTVVFEEVEQWLVDAFESVRREGYLQGIQDHSREITERRLKEKKEEHE